LTALAKISASYPFLAAHHMAADAAHTLVAQQIVNDSTIHSR